MVISLKIFEHPTSTSKNGYTMKIQPLLIALTVMNLVLLVFLLSSRATPMFADDAQILKGKGLQIVDDDGRVRASITVHPAGLHKPTGIYTPETVVLRLIDENGRPEIKIAATKEGGGYTVIGETDATQAMLHADGPTAFVKVQNKDGKMEVLRPK